MPDLLTELAQIAQRMDELATQAHTIELLETLNSLENAALEVGNSASGSWFGYQANVYYNYFMLPEKNAFFDKDRGLERRWEPPNRTAGDWKEYDFQVVIREIERRAGNPDMKPALDLRARARKTFQQEKMNLLSILDIELTNSQSQFLSEIREELRNLTTRGEEDIQADWRPEPPDVLHDLRAIQGRWGIPPHLRVLSRVTSIRKTLEAGIFLAQMARNTEAHISRRQASQPTVLMGSNVFIGHGHSPVWRELKDFIEGRLGLATDEFNRVSAAGIPTTERLEEMIEAAGFAFLVMTGEDEQTDGNIRARENVVHEVGLFQGKLGFKKAIVLLEQGCEEFSNITGLGQIRFPKGDIIGNGASEEIRKVLEREGLLNR